MALVTIDTDILRGLTPDERAIYLAVMSDPHISYENLADASGVSRPTVARVIIRMKEKGYLAFRRVGKRNFYLPLDPTHEREPASTEPLEPQFVMGKQSHADTDDQSQAETPSIYKSNSSVENSTPYATTAVISQPSHRETAVADIDWDRPGPSTDAAEPKVKMGKPKRKPVRQKTMFHASVCWENLMLGIGIDRWNRGHLGKVLRDLNKTHPWDEVEVIISHFVIKYREDIIKKSSTYDPVRIFEQQIINGLEAEAISLHEAKQAAMDETTYQGRLAKKWREYGKNRESDNG